MIKKILALAAIIPLLAMAGPLSRSDSEKSAQALADRCNHEVAETWLALSRGIDSLKDATQLRAVTNLFDLAAASTNRLAGIVAILDKDQTRLSVITNDINQQTLELVDKQALRAYVESDLQVLQNAKQVAAQDRDVIADFLTHEKPRWTAMIDVLLRLYPESQALSVMHNQFSSAADDIRTAIESHRATAAASPPDAPAARPAPPRASLPATPEDRTAFRSVTPPAPPPVARRATVDPPQIYDAATAYAGLSEAAGHALVLLNAGFQPGALLDFIKQSGPFELSSDHIMLLRSQGVPERLIVAMLKRDRALHRRD